MSGQRLALPHICEHSEVLYIYGFYDIIGFNSYMEQCNNSWLHIFGATLDYPGRYMCLAYWATSWNSGLSCSCIYVAGLT